MPYGSSGEGIELPEAVLFPSVTKAHELFSAGARLASPNDLKVVIDLPVDLDAFDTPARKQIDRFLRVAKQNKVNEGYIAATRKAWWSVGLEMPRHSSRPIWRGDHPPLYVMMQRPDISTLRTGFIRARNSPPRCSTTLASTYAGQCL